MVLSSLTLKQTYTLTFNLCGLTQTRKIAYFQEIRNKSRAGTNNMDKSFAKIHVFSPKKLCMTDTKEINISRKIG